MSTGKNKLKHLALEESIRILVREFVAEKDMGEWAFADQRKDLKLKGIQEPNVPLENKLLKVLENYVINNVALPPWACERIIDYRREGLYSDVFADVPNGIKTLYRGVALNKDAMKKLVGDRELSGTQGKLTGRFVWLPRPGKPASGFSTDRTESSHFNLLESGEYRIIMHAPVSSIDSDMCFSLVNGLYRVRPIDNSRAEQEVLVFGPVSITTIEWQTQSDGFFK
jgi:hypothetical protein